jgi:tight adherence protein C
MPLILISASSILIGAIMLMFFYMIAEHRRTMRRIRTQVIAQARPDADPDQEFRLRMIERFDDFARMLGVHILTDTLERGRVAKLMAAAGLRRAPVEYVIAIKSGAALVLMIFGIFLVPLAFPALPDILATLSGVAGGVLAGWRLPDFILSKMADWRQAHIEGGIPDALDLLVVCAEAGLALETALDRIGNEMKQSHRQLSDELLMTSAEIRLLPERVQALENFAARTGVVSARVIATTLSQTLRYGTPLSQSLRILANEMRTNRLLVFEAKAGKLPVMLTVPMIIFVLPCIFLVVGGPAFVNLFQSTGP